MSDSEAETPTFRLPATSRPERYDILLAPDLDTATFTGEESIVVVVLTETTELVLNALEIEIETASVTSTTPSADHCGRPHADVR